MAYMNQPYRDANKIQKLLLDTMQRPGTRPFDLAQCVRAWLDTEKLKREIRGLPPLAPHKISEVIKARVERLRSANAERTPTDFIDPDAHELAPPTEPTEPTEGQ